MLKNDHVDINRSTIMCRFQNYLKFKNRTTTQNVIHNFLISGKDFRDFKSKKQKYLKISTFFNSTCQDESINVQFYAYFAVFFIISYPVEI